MYPMFTIQAECAPYFTSRCRKHAVRHQFSPHVVTPGVGAYTVRLRRGSIGVPMNTCAVTQSRLACRWGLSGQEKGNRSAKFDKESIYAISKPYL